jgi:hypothetical protein
MLLKIIFIVLFAGIIVSLVSALIWLMNATEKSPRVFKALAWRAGLSVALFLFLILLNALGVVELHGLSPTAA